MIPMTMPGLRALNPAKPGMKLWSSGVTKISAKNP